MCELLVRTADDTNPGDPFRDALLAKRGDVIWIEEDGFEWGPGEKGLGIIVKVPGVPVSRLIGFMATERDDPLKSRPMRSRAFAFDLDAYKDDNWGDRPLTEGHVMAYKVEKPPLVNPDVLGGGKPEVIG
jgi:hypothetical protein